MSLAKLDWRAVLTIATVAMLLQQAFSYVCQIALPILADRIAEDFGISRAWLGLYLFNTSLIVLPTIKVFLNFKQLSLLKLLKSNLVGGNNISDI